MKKKSKDKSVVRRKSLLRLLFLDKELTDIWRFPVSTRQLAEDLINEEIREKSPKVESVMRLIQRDMKFLKEKLNAPIGYKKGQGWSYTNRNFTIKDTIFIERLLTIDHKLRNEEYPHPKTLAKKFGVSEKTIRNDIEFLNSLIPENIILEDDEELIMYDPKQKGYYYKVPNFRMPHIEKLSNSRELRDMVSRELKGLK